MYWEHFLNLIRLANLLSIKLIALKNCHFYVLPFLRQISELILFVFLSQKVDYQQLLFLY